MLQRFVSAILVLGLIMVLGGCQRRSPEDRLSKAVELYRKGDTLGAMLEARELVKKYPDDARALDAHMLLAQLYMQDKRPDEALGELEKVIAKVPPRDPRGVQALGQYLELLSGQKRYDQAMQTIDKLQKQYANDEQTSQQLTVWRANIMSSKGETTASRQIFTHYLETTTSPAERRGYREMIARTYFAEGNNTAALELFSKGYEEAKDPLEKMDYARTVAEVYANSEDYQQVRKWLEQATGIYDEAAKDELDANRKTALALRLAGIYQALGNYPGAERMFQAILAGPTPDPRVAPRLWEALLEIMVREGKIDEAIAFVREQAPRYPQMPMARQAELMEQKKGEKFFETQMPPDTQPLVLKFEKDPLLAPKNLPKAEAVTSASEGLTTETQTTAAASEKPAEATEKTTPPSEQKSELTTKSEEASTTPSAKAEEAATSASAKAEEGATSATTKAEESSTSPSK